MEFYCHYCEEFFPVNDLEGHFLYCHNQVTTLEQLKERMSIVMGGLEMRESSADDDLDKRKKFQTNNFSHDI